MTQTTQAPVASSPATEKAYSELVALAREANLLGGTTAILDWDQEVIMPPGGVDYRSHQQALLARLTHEFSTSKRVSDLLCQCEADRDFMASGSPRVANVRELRRDYDRAVKLPAQLVCELAEVTSKAQHEWALARKGSDFARFLPWLDRIVKLNRQKAQCYGIPRGGEAWDALADTFEPGCNAASVEGVFTPLRKRLVELNAKITSGKRRPDNRFNETALAVDKQMQLMRTVVEAIGFDFSRGRLDTSTHPFCGGSHCNDVRITVRFNETCVNDALGSAMHEAGHAMYEQGLLSANIGTPMGSAVSLGIHESQSRLWENQVGRSKSFWQWAKPRLSECFGASVAAFSIDELYGAANVVEPGFIRVDADEATYNLHVMVRFELERLLISGAMDPKDLPGEWNRRYKEYLGLDVPDDRRGCLQDVHWSMGSFGYFPTYTLGTLYSAQFFAAAQKAIPGLEAGFASGEFAALRSWLGSEIHAHGRRYLPEELCRRVTGAPLSADPFLSYLETKLAAIYGF